MGRRSCQWKLNIYTSWTLSHTCRCHYVKCLKHSVYLPTKSWYPHFFNTKENMDYVGRLPTCYGVDAMSDAERSEFLEWYETKLKYSITGTCSKTTTRLMSACWGRRVKFSGVNLFKSGKWKFSWNLWQLPVRVINSCYVFLQSDTTGKFPKRG
jgi:hypothetical protein